MCIRDRSSKKRRLPVLANDGAAPDVAHAGKAFRHRRIAVLTQQLKVLPNIEPRKSIDGVPTGGSPLIERAISRSASLRSNQSVEGEAMPSSPRVVLARAQHEWLTGNAPMARRLLRGEREGENDSCIPRIPLAAADAAPEELRPRASADMPYRRPLSHGDIRDISVLGRVTRGAHT